MRAPSTHRPAGACGRGAIAAVHRATRPPTAVGAAVCLPGPTCPRGAARAATPRPPLALPAWAAAVLAPSRRTKRSPAEDAALQQLIALTTDPALAKGAKGGRAARARVEAAIDALIAASGGGPSPPTASDPAINGVWELVWTTEKETLAFDTTLAPLFRTAVDGIYQVIDVPGGTLQNVISFATGGAFVVDSSCVPDDRDDQNPGKPCNPSRLNFKFNAARLDAFGKEGWLKLPPKGQGWFDTVWLDPRGEWRAARDAAAIPLGRAGSDLLVRARSGTGKTAAFGVIAVGVACPTDASVQVLALSPTREVALQTADVLAALGARAPPSPPGLAVAALIGGLAPSADAARLRRPAQLVAGTPGRVAALASRGDLVLTKVKLLILDEVDALLAPGGPLRRDVEAVAGRCPPPPRRRPPGPAPPGPAPPGPARQTLAFSATLDAAARSAAASLMGPDPALVDPSGEDAGPALLGVAHYYVRAAAGGGDGDGDGDGPSLDARAAAAASALARTPFCQAALFTSSRARAARLAAALTGSTGHAVALLSGGLSQPQRMDALSSLRSFGARLAVATDVGARGVDLERVTLVVNVDAPPDAATLAHRAGRAGRFGGRGTCVSVVGGGGGVGCGDRDLASLQAALSSIGAAPALALPATGLDAASAHGGYAPPSAEEEAAWAAHERRAAEVAAGGGAGEGTPPPPPPPPPRPRPPGTGVLSYAPADLLGLRPAASPRPAGLPPAVARKAEGAEGAVPPPPATPGQPVAARPQTHQPPPPPPAPAYDDSVYDDEAALAAAIIAAHHAAEGGEEEEVGGGWADVADHRPPPPPPPPPPAALALPDDALVPVPAALLRRYYELEWDAWARRVEAWRAVPG